MPRIKPSKNHPWKSSALKKNKPQEAHLEKYYGYKFEVTGKRKITPYHPRTKGTEEQ